MSYLLAKYTLLFLLTALVAFLLGQWWARRRLIDVTDSYHSLTRTLDSNNRGWEQLSRRLDGLEGSVSSTLQSQIAAIPKPDIPETDLSGVESKLATLEARINSLPAPKDPDFQPLNDHIDAVAQAVAALPKPQATDLSSVESKLAAFEAALMSLPVPQPPDLKPITEHVSRLETSINALPIPDAVDLAPLSARIDGIQRAVDAIPAPQLPEPVDLAPVFAEIRTMRSQIEAIEFPSVDTTPIQSRLGAVETALRTLDIPKPIDIDLAPIQSRLAAVEEALRSVPTIETHAAPDLAPLSRRLTDMEQALARLPGALPKTDLGAVNARLTALEEALKTFRQSLSEQLEAARKPEAPATTSGPRLLTKPEFGAPDDLKLISGVGPKLEKLLHKNGVYYFWQIASWSDADVLFVDAQLEVFTGRIARDNWVHQANTLKNAPSAATAPD